MQAGQMQPNIMTIGQLMQQYQNGMLENNYFNHNAKQFKKSKIKNMAETPKIYSKDKQ